MRVSFSAFIFCISEAKFKLFWRSFSFSATSAAEAAESSGFDSVGSEETDENPSFTVFNKRAWTKVQNKKLRKSDS